MIVFFLFYYYFNFVFIVVGVSGLKVANDFFSKHASCGDNYKLVDSHIIEVETDMPNNINDSLSNVMRLAFVIMDTSLEPATYVILKNIIIFFFFCTVTVYFRLIFMVILVTNQNLLMVRSE
jgi:hypothetical protein